MCTASFDLFLTRFVRCFAASGWRASLLFVLVSAVLLASSGGSIAAEPGDGQKMADVQRLMANDEDVAALKKQLGAKEISNVDYTKRLQELTKARNEILAQYDRNGQRELVGLYNAAKKDAAIAARQAAVAQAQAAKDEAARKVQAARDAAAADAKAKADAAQQAAAAAKEAAAAEKQGIQDDARAYISLVMQHDRMVVKEAVEGPNEADQKQMAEYLRQGMEIRNKYAKGAALAAHTNDFAAQVAQFDKDLVVPATKEWVADALPTPEKVVAAYRDVEHQVGALRFVDRVLRDNVGTPWPELAKQKSAAYVAAVDRIDPPSGSGHFAVAKQADELAKDPEFRMDVTTKLLGSYGLPYVAAAKADIKAQHDLAEWRKIGLESNLIFLAVLLVPIIFLLIGQRAKGAAESTKDNDPFGLPAALREVEVFRKKYRVNFDSGRIYEKDVWTETHTSTTTTPGSTTYSGNVVISSTPATTTTHVSTTVYHRYWTRTPDGQEVWKKFSDAVFLASINQIISTLAFKTDIMVAYNHATGDFVPLKSGYKVANRYPGRWVWLASCAVGSVGFFLLRPPGGDPLYINPEGQPWNHVVSAGIIGVAVGSLIWVVLIKNIVQMIRHWQFRKQYAPRLAEFVHQLTPKLVAHYKDQPLAQGMVEKA